MIILKNRTLLSALTFSMLFGFSACGDEANATGRAKGVVIKVKRALEQ